MPRRERLSLTFRLATRKDHSQGHKWYFACSECLRVQKLFQTSLPSCEKQTSHFAKNTHFFWAILALQKSFEKFFVREKGLQNCVMVILMVLLFYITQRGASVWSADRRWQGESYSEYLQSRIELYKCQMQGKATESLILWFVFAVTECFPPYNVRAFAVYSQASCK